MYVFMNAMLYSAANALSLVPLLFSRIHVAEQDHHPANRSLSNSLTKFTVKLIMNLVVVNTKVRSVGIDDFNSCGVTPVAHLEVEAHDTW